jgi:hypothetical protein
MSQNRPIQVSKDPYFYADFKNVNLPEWQNVTKKSYWWKTNFLEPILRKKNFWPLDSEPLKFWEPKKPFSQETAENMEKHI